MQSKKVSSWVSQKFSMLSYVITLIRHLYSVVQQLLSVCEVEHQMVGYYYFNLYLIESASKLKGNVASIGESQQLYNSNFSNFKSAASQAFF